MRRYLNMIKEKHQIADGIVNATIVLILLLLLTFFSRDLELHRSEVIIVASIIICLTTLLMLFVIKKLEFHKYVFVFLIVCGTLSLLTQPILNIPDEISHFIRAELISRGQFIMDPQTQEYDTILSVIEMQADANTSYLQSSIRGKKIDYTPCKSSSMVMSNASFLYFPQAIGIFIAKILSLDVIWMLWLGRFMNLLIYSVLISMAIKIAPLFKSGLFFIAALPMSIQQAASFNPDAMINGLALLMVAYYIYIAENKSVKYREIILFTGLGILTTVSKITNIFFTGLILTVTLDKSISKKRSILIKSSVIGMVAVIGCLNYMYMMSFPSIPAQQIYLDSIDANAGRQIQYILSNTIEWIRMFGSSITYQFSYYISQLNSFGWLEYEYPLLTIISIFAFGKICFQEKGMYINRRNKCLILLIILGIVFSVCLALYITWTTVGAADISGVQGRYFIPMFALIPLMCSSPNNGAKTVALRSSDIAVSVGMIGAMLITTATRYY